ncbi:N-acetylmuramoyl-L-alanine amidase [Shewanella sp. Choline-02u-19]|jgi:N-acetylmuramoyl-L-alanine amidase|uniref:N-acetylmuramoyl-L-alanine amidase n=1 Tax=unclassified Shewanella TaxID=196818 RepID=UPI000C33C61D|nr:MULTISPECIES: N-acetylmuramoyl-L-alanine amidase [unclassified Shewanella]PKG55629.1 N-acetylmuramoyl-L-alanine amidase [Shewanella sp. GutDb-MelDb]PKG76513.1 N-acetylmuramoyl-L-alanine amidase [Shewanella sp. GutCb]PKH55439.1 N-acetylmuramoyl-L-alanine amidase [Shewanella sp. Bg11-22]PKI28786.1 N-acetylmuramoyl-L-alanine amidase [Shewanella sp. Choline-02u-19]
MIINNNIFKLVVLLFTFGASFFAQSANKLEGVRVWAAPESTRIVFDLSQSPSYTHFTLTNPYRLVVDLKNASNKVDLAKIANNSKLVKKIRKSTPPEKGTLRIVIDLVKPLRASLFALPPTAPYGNRLVVDLDSGSAKPKSQSAKPVSALRDVVVAIDAGHGGDDPGSIGPTGMYEKKVVLQIAKKVAKKINATPGMKAVMTRTGDYFVNLNRRSEIARDSKADLLISIHADAFTSPQPQGASVWVLSMRRANSEIGRWLEQKEKHSELLGGAGEIIQNTDNEQYLAMTLLDMSMDRSMAISHNIADDVLSNLGKVTKLHKHKPESASFAVLKSPDIPSILVETGFISNHREERLLSQREHQNNIAKAVHKGVVKYFEANPPANTLLASRSNTKHKVRSGESLSVIAHRYQISISRLKKANRLKSNTLKIGQTLIIPRA